MAEWPKRCRRKYVRLKVPGQFGEMYITAIGPHRIKSNSRRVLVLDISPGGLRFVSGLRFPARRKIRVCVKVVISDLCFEAEGMIVWRKSNENVYEYGVMFEITKLHRAFLIRMLNQLYAEMYPEHQRIRQYYAYLSNRYLQEQRSRIDYTV